MLSELTSSVHRALVLIGTGDLIFAIAAVTAVCIVTLFLVRMFIKFVQYCGCRQVLCPETGGVAKIRIDALHAAVSSAVADPELQVSDCSRWPARQGCRQECVLRNRV
jgi:hypothetical protein